MKEKRSSGLPPESSEPSAPDGASAPSPERTNSGAPTGAGPASQLQAESGSPCAASGAESGPEVPPVPDDSQAAPPRTRADAASAAAPEGVSAVSYTHLTRSYRSSF